MLSEIPPHGCGVPWPGPGPEGGVAEWRWGCRNGSLAGQGLERTVLPVRGGGRSPVGGRDLAVGMSRRDRSPVGNGCGEGFPEPLQGRGTSPQIARIARVSAERICGNLRGLRAICSVAVHRRLFDGAKIRKMRVGLRFFELEIFPISLFSGLFELEKLLPHSYIPLLEIS